MPQPARGKAAARAMVPKTLGPRLLVVLMCLFSTAGATNLKPCKATDRRPSGSRVTRTVPLSIQVAPMDRIFPGSAARDAAGEGQFVGANQHLS